jgi:hypothetical protein
MDGRISGVGNQSKPRSKSRKKYGGEALEAETKAEKKKKHERGKKRNNGPVKDCTIQVPRPTKEGRRNPPPSGTDRLRYDAYDHWVKDAIRARLPKKRLYDRDEFSCLRVLYSTLLCEQRPYPYKRGRRVSPLAKHPEKFQRVYKGVVWLVCRTGFLRKETGQSRPMIRKRLRWLIRVGLVEEARGDVGTPVGEKARSYGSNTRLIRVKYELADDDPVVDNWKASGGEVDENLIEGDEE